MKSSYIFWRGFFFCLMFILVCANIATSFADEIPGDLIDKAATYYASQRWQESRILSKTPYYALDGSINAWAVIFVKKGFYYETEEELSAKMAQGGEMFGLAEETGTVLIAARSDLYPMLEMYDGVAPHLRFAEDVSAATGNTGYLKSTISRTFYLGPIAYMMETTDAPAFKDGSPSQVVDPIEGKIFDMSKRPANKGGGRLASASGVKQKIPSEDVWASIAKEGQPPLALRKKSNASPDHYVAGVPYYHQHRYDKYSCGPTACTVVMGYWDMNGYGNLIDNGWCMEDIGGKYPEGGGYKEMGHVWEAVYHMMECVDYSQYFGTFPWDMEEGIEAFCGWERYANQTHLDATEMYYFDWSDITRELDAARPVIWNWWIDSYDVSTGHFVAIVGCDNDHTLYVHVNWPGYYRFPGYFYEVDWDNVLGTDEWIITVKPTDEPFECIWSEDFEGYWGPWQWRSYGANSAKWWSTNWHAHNYTSDPYPPYGSLRSNYSAYCNGKDDEYSRSDYYKPNQSNALILGPFSTLGRTKGEIMLYAANNSPDPDDRLGVLVSTDGVNFKGNWYRREDLRFSGWTELHLDFANVPELGSVLDKPKVWAAIWFKSDEDAIVGDGAYVDDITIRVWPYDPNPLPAPNNLKATDNRTDLIHVTWDAVPGATHYHLRESANGKDWYDANPIIWQTENFYEKKNALLEQTYHFTVQAATGPAGTQASKFDNYDTGRRASPSAQNLQASDGTKNWVEITWEYTGGMGTWFRVYRALNNTGPFTPISEWWYCNNLSWTDEPPKQGITYYYKVLSSAKKSENAATSSNVDSGWAKTRIPKDVNATDGFPAISVSCNYEAGYYFQFYRSDHPEGTFAPISGWIDTHWSDNRVYFGDDTALPGVTYYYRAKKSPSNAGTRESAFSMYNGGWRTMPAPKNVTATDGTEARKIRISWDAVAGAGYYSVYVSDKKDGIKYPLSIWKANTYYDYIDATAGVTYWFWVQAAKTYGGYMPGDFSKPDDGWANLPPPENVNADQNLYEDRIGVRWAIVNGAYGYDIYRSESMAGNKILIKGYFKGASYDDTSAEPGKQYYYWLKTIMAYSGGFRSSDFSLPATGIRKIHPPTNLQATDGTESSKVHVTWDAVPNVPYYKVYRAESLVGQKVEVSPGWTTKLSYDDYGAFSGKTYYYFVRGSLMYSESWASDFSAPESGWRGFTKPFGMTASDGTNPDAVEMYWGDMPGARYFQIYRADRINGVFNAITPWTEIVESSSYYDSTATPGTVYWYRVSVSYDSIGERKSPMSESDSGWRGVRKWGPTPNITDGIGQLSYKPSAQEGGAIIVDDFQCQDGLPIQKIAFWGSYAGYRPDTGGQVSPPAQKVVGFLLTWYAYDDSNPLLPKPGAILAQETCNTFTEEWYFAQRKYQDIDNYAHIFYYECALNSPWNQTLNQKYFLSVRAIINMSQQYYIWQWWPAEQQWGLPAHQDMGQGFNPLGYPQGHRFQFQGMDMAFQIWTAHKPTPTPSPTPTRTATRTPTPTPTPTISPTPTPYPKSDQPPNLMDGYDIPSWKGKSGSGPLVADDWFCMDGKTIRAIRWWGSYIGYEKTTQATVAPPQVKPAGFNITIYSWNNGDPGSVLFQEYNESVEEKWDGFVPDWEHQGQWHHEFKYICRLETPFNQSMGTQYFISIQAVYPTTDSPAYPWGWLNAYMPWYEPAKKKEVGGGWTSLYYPAGHRLTGQQMSMAFSMLDYAPPTPTPTPNPTPTQTPPPTPTTTPSPTPSPTPNPTPNPTPTPTDMTWSQNYNGQDGYPNSSWYWDVAKDLKKDSNSAIVADDWQSSPGISLAKITWWGAYEGWSESTQTQVAPPANKAPKFRISFHNYVEGYPPTPSLGAEFIEFTTTFTEKWERAIPKWDEPGKWIHIFKYEYELPAPHFIETQKLYFISIAAAFADSPSYPWGWMNSYQHWNADAVQWISGGSWEELVWPLGHRFFPKSMDMAFQISILPMATPTPTQTPLPTPTPSPTPTPVNRFTAQPPNLTDGFDVESWQEFKGVNQALVADDWEAISDEPVTGIRWWGSYPTWQESQSERVSPPIVKPVYFILSMHKMGLDNTPGEIISEDFCRGYEEIWCGAIPQKDAPNKWEHEFVYRGFLEKPMQPQKGEKYYLNIQAVFTTTTAHLPWGWLNSEQSWNNPAAQSASGGDDWQNLAWHAGHRLAGKQMDMAFELWTGNGPAPDPKPQNFELTLIAQNGTITAKPHLRSYDYGSSVTLEATPNNGYYFTHWSGDLPYYYVPPAPFSINPFSMNMDSDKVITAHFSSMANSHNLRITSAHGSVGRRPNYPVYPPGTKVTLGAKADEGYFFSGWTGDVPTESASSNPLELTMDSDKDITAEYEILTPEKLADYIVGKASVPRADVNGDGRTDAADIVTLILMAR